MKSILIAIVCSLALLGCGDDEPTVELAPVGAACTVAEGCASDVCATSYIDGTVIEGGVCTFSCDFTDNPCEEGQECLRYNRTGEFLCFARCELETECRVAEGWTCHPFVDELGKSIGVCIPPL